MADLFLPVQGQDYKLAGSGVTLSATTIILQSFLLPDDSTEILTAMFGDTGYATLEPGTSKEENISFTTVTQNADGTATLTGVTRGLQFVSPYTTSTGLRQSHAGGVTMRLTNSAPFYNELSGKDNDETITGTWTFPGGGDAAAPVSGTVYAAPTNDLEYAAKKYIDDTAIAGAAKATDSTYGITTLSVAAASAIDPIAVGDNDTRVIPVDASSVTADMIAALAGTGTPSAANEYVTDDDVSDAGATGKVVRLSTTNYPAASGAAITAIATANITGDLTDGSNADALHIHPVLNKMLGVGYAADSDYYAFQLPYIAGLTSELWTLDNFGAVTDYTTYIGRAAGAAVGSIITRVGILMIDGDGSYLKFNSGKKVIVEQDLGYLVVSPAATIESGWGLTNIAAAFQDYDDQTADSCCFVVDGTSNNHKLYAKTGNAGTGHTETEITGITLGDVNTYRIEFDPGVDVKFYVNGTLEATITTTLPDGATDIKFGRGCSASGNYQPNYTSIPSFAIEK